MIYKHTYICVCMCVCMKPPLQKLPFDPPSQYHFQKETTVLASFAINLFCLLSNFIWVESDCVFPATKRTMKPWYFVFYLLTGLWPSTLGAFLDLHLLILYILTYPFLCPFGLSISLCGSLLRDNCCSGQDTPCPYLPLKPLQEAGKVLQNLPVFCLLGSVLD